ncbi:MAG: ATP-binding cassette domain-containing protein, partial [Vreelandella alkaliphila]
MATPATTDTALSIQNLTVSYHNQPVLWDINLEIPTGVMAGIVGPNGAGKSTLIKSLLELVPSLSGEVMVHGRPYASQRRRVGYVPQRSSVDWDFP